MYEVWKIEQGATNLVDSQRDPEQAKQHAIEHSRLSAAVFYVAREGFGTPLYFVLDGVISDAAEVMRRGSMPNRPAPLCLEPPVVIEDVEPFSAPSTTEETQVVNEDAPKPYRSWRGPKESK